MEIGERVKKVRNYYGLTQNEFAEKLLLSRNTVATYEIGRCNPSDSALSLISKEFNVSFEWLKNGTGGDDIVFVETTKYDMIMKMLSSAFKEEENSFKTKFFYALSKLDEKDWETIEKLIDNIIFE